jgi:hypothetical protein
VSTSRQLTPKQNTTANAADGDCFVICSDQGLFWDGSGWTPEWKRALPFRGPVDPSAPAQELSDELRHRLGVVCNVAYIPGSEITL